MKHRHLELTPWSLVYQCHALTQLIAKLDLAQLICLQVQLPALKQSGCVHKHPCGDGVHQFLTLILESLARIYLRAQSLPRELYPILGLDSLRF